MKYVYVVQHYSDSFSFMVFGDEGSIEINKYNYTQFFTVSPLTK
jgi:hypothetical protein